MLQILRQAVSSVLSSFNIAFANTNEKSRFRSYTIACSIGIPLMLLFGVADLITGKFLLASPILLTAAGLTCGWFLLLKNLTTPIVIYRLGSLIFALLVLSLMYVGGTDGSKAMWGFVFPLLVFFLLGSSEGALWTLLLLTGSQVILWNPWNLPGLHQYPSEFAIRFSLSFLCVTVITYFYEKFRFAFGTKIERQNSLLNNEIDERRRVEDALKKSEQKYKAIYQQAAEGIIIVDNSGIILESNQQMSAMLGYSNKDLVGIDLHDLIHPEDLQRIPSQIPSILSGETVLLDRRMRTANGAYRLFERSGRLVEDNNILLLYRDITDRKAAEAALEKANRELERLANIDGLTQIANRRKFENTLRLEWQRLSREQSPLTMILGDIDYFKQYNDIYGHQEGDNCLITIAQTLERSLLRPADLAARFGGEEFIILLPNTQLQGGMQIADKIRKSIANLRIPHQDSKCSPYVTMSLGVSSMIPNKDTLPDDLIAIADRALYTAKQGGRNRVELGNTDLLK